MLNEQFFSYIMARTSYIQWNDDVVHFEVDQKQYKIEKAIEDSKRLIQEL
jgi:hypothetical protein